MYLLTNKTRTVTLISVVLNGLGRLKIFCPTTLTKYVVLPSREFVVYRQTVLKGELKVLFDELKEIDSSFYGVQIGLSFMSILDQEKVLGVFNIKVRIVLVLVLTVDTFRCTVSERFICIDN